MACCRCEHLLTNYPIKVIDTSYNNPFMEDDYHFEEGYRCTYNGEEGTSLSDLQKGKCRRTPKYIWEVLSQDCTTLESTRVGVYLNEEKANEKLTELRNEAQKLWDYRMEQTNDSYYIRRTELND